MKIRAKKDVIKFLGINVGGSKKDVIKFLGIDVDGSRALMVLKLMFKGFKRVEKGVLRGEFNIFSNAYIYVHTIRKKVGRIIVTGYSKDQRNASEIISVFNDLYEQFSSCERYTPCPENKKLGDKTDEIPSNSIATFYQGGDKMKPVRIKITEFNGYNIRIVYENRYNVTTPGTDL